MSKNAYKRLLKQNTKNVYNKRKLLKEVHDCSALKTFIKKEKSLRKFMV